MITDENVSVTITIDPDLLKRIDGRAAELDLNRSQYLRRLAREEIEKTKPKQPELLTAENA